MAGSRWEHHPVSVESEITVEASLGVLWRAWAEPQHLARWFVDEAWGELESGGTYIWAWHDFGLEVPHDILVWEPRKRLVLSARQPEGERILLEVRLTRRRRGTGVRVLQSSLADDGEEQQDVKSGWNIALTLLKHYCENHFGADRKGRFLASPAEYQPERLAPFFREEEGLSRWLTCSGSLGEVGSDFRMKLLDGTAVTGRVLADTGTEMAVSWQEIGGALELKAFSAGPEQQVLGLRLHRWDGGETERLESLLFRSLDRLVRAGFLPAYAH